MKTIAFHNLGCKVNEYELEVMQQIAQERGYEIVQFSQKADIYVVNTCTVTNIADRKSRQMLHRARKQNPEAVVVAVGCYVQTGAQTLQTDGAVDLCIGNNHKTRYLDLAEDLLKQREAGISQDAPVFLREDLKDPCPYEKMDLTRCGERTRATLKIQDGCNQFCTYCAIPYARGRIRSREKQEIFDEVRRLLDAGYHEIVLTGIHVGSYGMEKERSGDYGGETGLISLLEEVCEIPGLERLRISSVEPRVVTKENAKRLAALKPLCPHFHLSLQSGCDSVLQRMNRHYTAGRYYESVEYLREAFDHPAITTDVIVGFPGETEEEFETTVAFLEKCAFYDMHIFQYSRRNGTIAAKMSGQVPEAVKKERSAILLRMAERHSLEFRRSLIGKEREVLFEEEEIIGGKPYLVGFTTDYVKAALPLLPGEKGAKKQGPEGPCAYTITSMLSDEVVLLGTSPFAPR